MGGKYGLKRNSGIERKTNEDLVRIAKSAPNEPCSLSVIRRRHPRVSGYVIYRFPLKSARPPAPPLLRKLRRLSDHLIIPSVVDDAAENGARGGRVGKGRKARRNDYRNIVLRSSYHSFLFIVQ